MHYAVQLGLKKVLSGHPGQLDFFSCHHIFFAFHTHLGVVSSLGCLDQGWRWSPMLTSLMRKAQGNYLLIK